MKKIDPSCPAFHGHSRLLELTQIDRLPVTSYKCTQEIQLSLINSAMRLEVNQGQKTWYHSICSVWFPISLL